MKPLRFLGGVADSFGILPFVLFAAIMLAAWFGLVFGALVPARAQSPNHHPFHKDFYQHWKQPGSTASCCNARVPGPMGGEVGDCEPTQAEMRAGQWYAWLRQESRWIQVPDAKVLRERNPNIFDGHLCWQPSSGVLCFVPPSVGG